ncbi:cell wall integrity protein scw1-like isoform X1 [Miscanthus floridulus]|uniref:cell wall integrity protein scw1-like isoform X1 n=1 Tax=Miscanthus floridulus TaxID=154761 RepID=UPI003459188C
MAASYFNHSSSSYPPPPPPPGTSPYGAYRHAYPPAPAPPAAYGAYYDRAEQALPARDELRTLFIAGLPADAKPREVYNLFRDFPGYVSSHLRTGKSSQAYAFAVFADQQSALTALSATNGMVFDLEKNCSLHVDLAKSNSRSKRLRSDDISPYSPEKRTRKPRGFPDSGAGSNIYISGMGNSSHSLSGYPSAQSYTSLESSTSLSKDPSTFAPQNNPPCPTLFVANLGPACSEQELIDVFSSCAGFVKLKMQNKLGAPVAFVDFKDAFSSTEAINRLQGVILYSSPGEGIRLEYAKSRMGLRKRDKHP